MECINDKFRGLIGGPHYLSALTTYWVFEGLVCYYVKRTLPLTNEQTNSIVTRCSTINVHGEGALDELSFLRVSNDSDYIRFTFAETHSSPTLEPYRIW